MHAEAIFLHAPPRVKGARLCCEVIPSTQLPTLDIDAPLYYLMKTELSPTPTMVERPASIASDEPKPQIPNDDKYPNDMRPSTAEEVSRTEGARDFVTWDGPDDPENPKNWSYAYKWWVTIIVCILSLEV